MDDYKLNNFWRKSTRCGNTGCIEVAYTNDAVLLRDSKDPQGAQLRFSRTCWRSFLRMLWKNRPHP
jgi:hypothetical protein